MRTGLNTIKRLATIAALGVAAMTPAYGAANDFNAAFDKAFGTEQRAPQTFDAVYDSGFEQYIARLASGDQGRIGVAAIDLSTGYEVSVLGDQRFPMASTSKVAIAATFMAGVDAGRWSLTSEYPLLRPVRSAKFSSKRAPVREGNYISAREHLNLMISKSCNACTDALLRVIGGPEAVNAWMRKAGIKDFRLSRDIATLVRDDGEFDPATTIDKRDSATPKAMAKLLAGVYQGKWHTPESRDVIIQAMESTTTGKHRMSAVLPQSANIAHKTGTLSRTASDIGIFQTPDGRSIAVAIYVTGQSLSPADEAMNKREARRKRDARIANIARALYNGFSSDDGRKWADAQYSTGG